MIQHFVKNSSLKVQKMAYRTAAKNNEGLINGLVNQGIISSQKVISAMKQVDRGEFTLQGTKSSDSYFDSPQQIGYNATISAPHMHGMALE